jgi:hypothetical protein
MKIEIAGPDKIAHASRRPTAEFAFGLALRASSLRRIEADETDVRCTLVESDRVAIDDANVGG